MPTLNESIENIRVASQGDMATLNGVLGSLSSEELKQAFESTSSFCFLFAPIKRGDFEMMDFIYDKIKRCATAENPTHEYTLVDIATHLCETKKAETIEHVLDVLKKDVLPDRQADIIKRMSYKIAKNPFANSESVNIFSDALKRKDFEVPEIIKRSLDLPGRT